NLPALRNTPADALGVPRLQRVLQEWPELASIQLEVKTTDRDSLKIIADQLAQLIGELQIHAAATVTSMDIQLLHDMQHLHATIKRGYVAERFVRNPIDHALRLGCRLLAINWRRLTEADVQAAHRAGLQVSVW